MSQNNKQFKVLDEHIYFNNAQESQEYAKNNPGKVIVRNLDEQEASIEKRVVKKEKKLQKTPKMIFNYLNEHIVAQEEAKRDIALTLYYHSLKSKYFNAIENSSPIMLVGPTGSGKTFVVQKACEYMDMLFIHVDTSSMVPEGIKGYSISDLAEDIVKLSGYDINRAMKCVVFFDEVDKLFKNDENTTDYGSDIANQLLRFIEGREISLSKEVYVKTAYKVLSTSLTTKYMQFILGGAFQWIIDTKPKHSSSIGFTREEQNLSERITLEDLYKEGVPKELLGRMQTIVNLKKLSKEDYLQILTSSKSSPMHEFIQKIEFHGDKVEISDEALEDVARVASESELGVRALKQILKGMFRDALFNTADGENQTYRIKYEKQ